MIPSGRISEKVNYWARGRNSLCGDCGSVWGVTFAVTRKYNSAWTQRIEPMATYRSKSKYASSKTKTTYVAGCVCWFGRYRRSAKNGHGLRSILEEVPVVGAKAAGSRADNQRRSSVEMTTHILDSSNGCYKTIFPWPARGSLYRVSWKIKPHRAKAVQSLSIRRFWLRAKKKWQNNKSFRSLLQQVRWQKLVWHTTERTSMDPHRHYGLEVF